MKYYINHIGYCGRDDSEYLAHYGIKGMKWDPRKRQYKAGQTIREEQKKRLKLLPDRTQEAMDRATMGVNNARAAIADGRKGATRRWEYHPTIYGGSANEFYRENRKSKKYAKRLTNDVLNEINQKNPLTKKKQSVSLDELKKRKKLYSSWSKK